MEKLRGCFFDTNYLAKEGVFSYHSIVVFFVHPPLCWMPLYGERTGWGVWFFLFFWFHTPIYTNENGDSITKTVCRKKQHTHIVILFRMKILIRCKPAVIDEFNLLTNILSVTAACFLYLCRPLFLAPLTPLLTERKRNACSKSPTAKNPGTAKGFLRRSRQFRISFPPCQEQALSGGWFLPCSACPLRLCFPGAAIALWGICQCQSET